MPAQPLFSERQGRPRQLGHQDLAALVFAVLARLDEKGYFDEAFGKRTSFGERPGGTIKDPEDFFARRLRTTEAWRYLRDPSQESSFLGYPDEDLLFDTLELLHAEAILEPIGTSDGPPVAYYRHNGQRRLRDDLNEVLALRSPPMEMLESGEIVEVGPDELHSLVEKPLPPGPTGDVVRAAVEEALHLFRGRGATAADRHAAVLRLAGALEQLRGEAKLHLLSQDETALFEIANSFAIRHHNAKQRTDYDRDLYLEWLFYWYLATVRLLVRIGEKTGTAV